MTTKPIRPRSSVGGRYGVERKTRSMVADEIRACAEEIFDGTDRTRTAAQWLHARADEIEQGDD